MGGSLVILLVTFAVRRVRFRFGRRRVRSMVGARLTNGMKRYFGIALRVERSI
jgi:hypothetical protein